jgi:membrane-bound metal-dependent hydrolase YbcI (DUF457 family)
MPLPISHGLIGASTVALWRPYGLVSVDWPHLIFGAFLAISPDFDFFLVWGLHMRGWHRGFTHSILMAVIVTILMLVTLGFSQIKNALAYGTAFLSHGLLDFATTKIGGGVKLLWPFLDNRFKLGLIGFSEFPYGFSVSEVVKSILIELLVFGPVLLLILLLRKFVFRASAQGVV